ncbi:MULTISPECIES: hypothetical protein [unclassified Kitasatospora]|uniref:hypothetical protein n=1 Tax=unclassified Kitasatospora TaxID=2633591 RepID=UPI0033FDC222
MTSILTARWSKKQAAEGIEAATGRAAESARLEEAERQASHAVWVDEFRASLSGKDRVEARSRLKHIADEPVEAAVAA